MTKPCQDSTVEELLANCSKLSVTRAEGLRNCSLSLALAEEEANVCTINLESAKKTGLAKECHCPVANCTREPEVPQNCQECSGEELLADCSKLSVARAEGLGNCSLSLTAAKEKAIACGLQLDSGEELLAACSKLSLARAEGLGNCSLSLTAGKEEAIACGLKLNSGEELLGNCSKLSKARAEGLGNCSLSLTAAKEEAIACGLKLDSAKKNFSAELGLAKEELLNCTFQVDLAQSRMKLEVFPSNGSVEDSQCNCPDQICDCSAVVLAAKASVNCSEAVALSEPTSALNLSQALAPAQTAGTQRFVAKKKKKEKKKKKKHFFLFIANAWNALYKTAPSPIAQQIMSLQLIVQ